MRRNHACSLLRIGLAADRLARPLPRERQGRQGSHRANTRFALSGFRAECYSHNCLVRSFQLPAVLDPMFLCWCFVAAAVRRPENFALWSCGQHRFRRVSDWIGPGQPCMFLAVALERGGLREAWSAARAAEKARDDAIAKSDAATCRLEGESPWRKRENRFELCRRALGLWLCRESASLRRNAYCDSQWRMTLGSSTSSSILRDRR